MEKNILTGDDIKSEMNVVPLIDVMLVLLIVFMIASPMITSSLDIKLPKTNVAPQSTEQTSPSTVVVSVNSRGDLFLTNTALSIVDESHDPKTLVLTLSALKQKQSNSRLFLRADKSTPYSRVVFALELIKSSGFDDVNLVTEEQG